VKPSIALNQNREAVRSLVAQYRVTNPRVFGSTARNEDYDGSDLDLLVDALPGTTLFHLGDLHHALEGLLGVPVDLRTPGDLHIRFRQKVVAAARPI
jgi:predicted nucleotidyltransferase